MLINFTDTYIEDINLGVNMVAKIQSILAQKEPYMGSSIYLDKLYALSTLISGIIDHLSNDDNSDPATNEQFLLCLRRLHQSDICGGRCTGTIDVRNYHQDLPLSVTNPAEGPVFYQNY
jgi:hypothetical protein